MNPQFNSQWSETQFYNKYAFTKYETWDERAWVIAEAICGGLLPKDTVHAIYEAIRDFKFMPGGRYIYYAGREVKFYNNCYIFKSEEDTREDWAYLSWKAERALMTGGGIGNDYSVYRPEGAPLGRTGGLASGPIPKMEMINGIGTHVMQGGSRRSAMYASLDWDHGDIEKFLTIKNWDELPLPGAPGKTYADAKGEDFNFRCPLDMTNISVNYDTKWVEGHKVNNVFLKNVEQAMRTAEPGFSFNFHEHEGETGRNACTEVTSSDDSDVCNLGSLNMARIDSVYEFGIIANLATQFLLCGTLRADMPYEKVGQVRAKNRRLGLGLMGVHEWLVQRGKPYGVDDELREWLQVYSSVSTDTARRTANELGVSEPVATRAVAPTGTIGILAGTTTGIEPIYATAYKRRYLKGGTEWAYQYVVDNAAKSLIERYDVDPDSIESSVDLARDYERRIKFQADVQDYVDMAISSTINMEAWGSDSNNPDTVKDFAKTLAHYAPRLRGFTCYPDGARGGQPLTSVPYSEAISKVGQEFIEQTHDICDITKGGGSCGV